MQGEESKRWMAQAIEDMSTARILFAAQRYGPCAFFCQQAAEKAIKSALYQVGERPWGHSLSSLLDQLGVVLKIDPVHLPQPEAQALDEHYIRPRYPDARLDIALVYDEETAQGALMEAQTLFAFVEKVISDVGKDADNRTSTDVG